MSWACLALPVRQLSLARAATSLLPWLRWSKVTATRPVEPRPRSFHAAMVDAAMPSMQACVCSRGCSSQRQATSVAASSRSPCTVVTIPPMTNDSLDTPPGELASAWDVGSASDILLWRLSSLDV